MTFIYPRDDRIRRTPCTLINYAGRSLANDSPLRTLIYDTRLTTFEKGKLRLEPRPPDIAPINVILRLAVGTTIQQHGTPFSVERL